LIKELLYTVSTTSRSNVYLSSHSMRPQSFVSVYLRSFFFAGYIQSYGQGDGVKSSTIATLPCNIEWRVDYFESAKITLKFLYTCNALDFYSWLFFYSFIIYFLSLNMLFQIIYYWLFMIRFANIKNHYIYSNNNSWDIALSKKYFSYSITYFI
jgi:hypothetical protein